MYNAKFVKSNGDVFSFGLEYSTIFDISPLSELDVQIGTNQGFQQIGDTIQTRGMKGVTRTIRGRIIGEANSLKRRMLTVFSPFASGKLYFDGKYYCNAVVKKTPAISVNDHDAEFSMMLYCPSPYWYAAQQSSYSMGRIIPAFSFPTTFTTHKFGTKNPSAFINVYNPGEDTSDFELEFAATGDVTTCGVLDINTQEFIEITANLTVGDVIRMYRDSGRLHVEKLSGGVATDIFGLLKYDSNLFTIRSGDNVWKMYAGTGVDNLSVEATFSVAYPGVYDGM